MDKRRLIIGLIVILAIPLYIWIAYYEIPDKAQVGEEKLQQDPLNHNFESVLAFENAYMGNGSNSNALFQSLPINEYKGTIEMEQERFLILVNYDVNATELGKKAERSVIYNATAAFLLIGNLQQLEMQFLDENYKVSRTHVEKWFDGDFLELKNPDVFKEKVQKQLERSDIDSWVAAYTKGE